MDLILPVYSQYSTFDYRYRFKISGDQITLKIFDVFQRVVFTLKNCQVSEADKRPSSAARELISKGFIPDKYFPRAPFPTPTKEECVSNITVLIDQFNEDKEGLEPWSLIDKDGEEHVCLQLQTARREIENDRLIIAAGQLSNISSTDYRIAPILIKMYILVGSSEDALFLTTTAAEALKEKHPEKAILLYKQLLSYIPTHWMFYTELSSLLKTPSERAHILIQGALAAIESGKHENAKTFCREAHAIYPNSFIDRLIDIDLMEDKTKSQIQGKLCALLKDYRMDKSKTFVQVCKMLIRLEYSSKLCQKIIAWDLQEKLSKNALKWLRILKNNESSKALSKVASFRDPIECGLGDEPEGLLDHSISSEFFTQVPDDAPQELWDCLGSIYLDKNQLGDARACYEKAFMKFPNFNMASKLADIFHKLGSISESVCHYYKASQLAHLNIGQVEISIQKIQELDPFMTHLSLGEQEQIARHKQRVEMEKKTSTLKSLIVFLDSQQRKKIQPKQAVDEKENPKDGLSYIINGVDWTNFSGERVKEKPQHKDMEELLAKPSPFVDQATIRFTHKQVFIPEGLQLKKLLDQAQEKGIIVEIDPATFKALSQEPIKEGYWTLMSLQAVPGTIACSRKQQEEILGKASTQTGLNYQSPTTLEFLYLLIMELVLDETKASSSRVSVDYIRCVEEVGGKPIFVGSFGKERIHVTACSLGLGTWAVHRFKSF